MGYGRRYRRYTRRRRRVRRRGRKIARVARRVFRRQIRKFAELKRVKVIGGPTSVGANWATTGLIQTAPYIDEGTGPDRRVGRRIFVRSIRLRATLFASPSTTDYTYLRLLVHKATTGTTPTTDSDTFGYVDDVYDVNATRSQFRQGRILRDITWRLGYTAGTAGSATPATKLIDMYIPINSSISFEGTSPTSWLKNQISFLWVSDDDITKPSITYSYETTFNDV